jgi:class 3 adenylate cyclase
VKLKPPQTIPALIVCGVLGIVGLSQLATLHVEKFDVFRRLEWMTYDWRVRLATNFPSAKARDLGFVFISNESIEALNNGSLDYQASLYWPRHVHGRLLQELAAQGVEAVAFDVLFAGRQRDREPALLPDGTQEMPDHFFARELRLAGNAILAAEKQVLPDELFRTNAWALGNIQVKLESDGILRRARAFDTFRLWHPLVQQAAQLEGFSAETNRITIAGAGRTPVVLPIDREGNFDQAALYEHLSAALGQPRQAPANVKRQARAWTELRVWDLGIVLAARRLQLDLAGAIVEPGRRIVLRGTNGAERVLPIDGEGRFLIDWSISPFDPALTRESFHGLLLQEMARRQGQTNGLAEQWRGKLAVVGSIASGNDLTDFGATPLEKETFLASRTWNIANSILTGSFIRRAPAVAELALILLLGTLAGALTWRLRTLPALIALAAMAALFTAAAVWLYVQTRYWLPLVLPLVSLWGAHFALVSWRAVFEQNERRRIKNIFAHIVSPNVVNELLQAEKLSLGGARRQVTVLFADMRGFTEMTDESHARAEAEARARGLDGPAAEALFEEQSRDVLTTVNLYLGAIADVVKRHDGTLDKYIGDCVMAFWGAPTPNDHHALTCVRAAIDAQRAIQLLNQERLAENKRRESENAQRGTRGQSPLPLLKRLTMGTGINTGIVTLGLMGSEDHISNYTVFGREVNLASRLEGLSGRGRILIGEATHQSLLRDDPELAAACKELAPATVKGFRTAVRMYEVPWRVHQPGDTSMYTEPAAAPGAEAARPPG